MTQSNWIILWFRQTADSCFSISFTTDELNQITGGEVLSNLMPRKVLEEIKLSDMAKSKQTVDITQLIVSQLIYVEKPFMIAIWQSRNSLGWFQYNHTAASSDGFSHKLSTISCWSCNRFHLVAAQMPGPGVGRSHSYDHATITQSDLCGFTQLASDKSPLWDGGAGATAPQEFFILSGTSFRMITKTIIKFSDGWRHIDIDQSIFGPWNGGQPVPEQA